MSDSTFVISSQKNDILPKNICCIWQFGKHNIYQNTPNVLFAIISSA